MVNFFYLDEEPKKCAEYYCDKHIVKIPIEIAQILSKIHHQLKTNIDFSKIYKDSLVIKNTLGPYKWTTESLDNYLWTCNLGLALINEYKYRYGKEKHKTEDILKYLLDNPPPFTKKEKTKFLLTNKFDLFQYVSNDPIVCSRYNYVELKCKNDKWTKRDKPIWFVKLKKKVDNKKTKLIEKILNQVKVVLPPMMINKKTTVKRFHSFLRVSYDFLFQGKWDIKAKLMNTYNENEPLINQLTFPQLYFLQKITKLIENEDFLEKLNIESLKYRKKQKYKKSMKTKEWLYRDPYKPKKFIIN